VRRCGPDIDLTPGVATKGSHVTTPGEALASHLRTSPSLGAVHVVELVSNVCATPQACGVPRLSAFYGIVITMYFLDHPPPHFHARYGEYDAQVAIASGEVLAGALPTRAAAMVREWTELHRAELEADWLLAVAERPLATIEGLP
jgi:hypothetical protein